MYVLNIAVVCEIQITFEKWNDFKTARIDKHGKIVCVLSICKEVNVANAFYRGAFVLNSKCYVIC